MYGNVPYSEAFKRINNGTLKYNDDQFIYRELFKEIDDARALINLASPDALSIAQYDVMLAGDMNRWLEFANTVELRMLLRMSNSTGAVATYRDARIAALAASSPSFVTSDVTINPGYSTATDAQMNPLNNVYTFTVAGAAQQNWTFVAMSGHAFKFLRNNVASNNTPILDANSPGTTNYPGVADPRATRLFRGATKAVTQGSQTVDVPIAGGTPGRIGYGLTNPYLAGSEAIIVAQDIVNLGTANGFVMTASEAHYLQAEAAVRYPSLGLNALSNFTAGIDKSCARLGVTTAAATTYKTAIATKAGLGWPASTTDDLKYKAILTQKWIALMGIHGIESFIEYNRTGYPATPLATTATQTRKPRRLIYPVSEYVANSGNVPNISPAQIFSTTDASHPFWLQGDPALGN